MKDIHFVRNHFCRESFFRSLSYVLYDLFRSIYVKFDNSVGQKE